MTENIARLLLYSNQEVFAEKKSGGIALLEVGFNDEEIPEEVLQKKAVEAWGIVPENLKLLCILPKSGTEFIHYYSAKDWTGSFEECSVEEIVAIDFKEMTEFAEKNDILAVEVLEKTVLGREFKKPSTIVVSSAHRQIDDEVDDILMQNRKPIVLQHESTDDFEIIPAVPKGQGRKQNEPTREGIDFEFLSRGKKDSDSSSPKSNVLEPSAKPKKLQKSVFAQH